MKSSRFARQGAAVTLADQLVAWARWRAGDGVEAISTVLRRNPAAARAVLWGDRR